MVTQKNSPLHSFPSAATGAALNKKVAEKSLKGNKRKRGFEKLIIPESLRSIAHESGSSLLVRPHNTAQVAEIVSLGSRHGLHVSVVNPTVPATHGSSRSGDIIIEMCTEEFLAIEIDKERMQVTVGAGVTSRMVDTALSEQDLITPLVGYTVGFGAFLSGGFGFASRLHGLTVDNILSAQIVLADGRILNANAVDYPDLFWALKGCGTSFGVVTQLTLRCYPLVRSFSANVIYPFDRESGADLIRHWRDIFHDAPKELYSNFVIAAGPQAPSGTVAILQICHLGSHDVGMTYYQRMSAFAGAKYHFKDCDEISYLRQQALVEAVLKGAAAEQAPEPETHVKYLIEGNILSEMPEIVLTETCDRFIEHALPGSIWCFELFGGAVSSVTDSCFPLSHRESKFHAASIMRVPVNDVERWRDDDPGRSWIRDVVGPQSPGGPLPSFLSTSHEDTREAKHYHDILRGSYGHANWSRLKTIKLNYDPTNCFDGGFDVGMLGYEEELVDGI